MWKSEAKGFSEIQRDRQGAIIDDLSPGGLSSENYRPSAYDFMNCQKNLAVFALVLTAMFASSCGEREVEQQPGYQYGLAEGKSIGRDEGREEMKVEMCGKIRILNDRTHSTLQQARICD